MVQKNHRPLAAITADIHKAERQNVFSLGTLLIEAKGQLQHGEWLPYIKANLYCSPATVDQYMAATRLVVKFPTVRNLGGSRPVCSYVGGSEP